MSWLGTGWCVVAGVVTVAADRFSKRAVAARLGVGQSVALARHVSIRHVRNRRDAPRTRRALALRVAALVLIVAAVLALARIGSLFQLAEAQAGLGAAIGGAAANLRDRGRADGAVLDFIAVGWWPPFNIADAAIVTGVAAALLFMR